MKVNYESIVRHYEECLEKHGDNHLGVDWPKLEDVNTRYRVMLDIIKYNEDLKCSVLDFGCGTAHLLEFIIKEGYVGIEYAGADISSKFIDVAKSKFHTAPFYRGDILDRNFKLPIVDYVVANGVFTEKRELTFDEMWQYASEVLVLLFEGCRKGLAFNVMSKNVQWERPDLFHVPLDFLTEFLSRRLSRNFIVRNDYGLYEYTVYVFKK